MENLYHKLFGELEEKLTFLEDKPEETTESTLKSLWFKASGKPVSAKKALTIELLPLTSEQIDVLNRLISERIEGKPLAHLTERQNFMGIEFISDNRALIPRAETEILAKAALKICREIAGAQNQVRVFDVCCGSGNVGLSIANAIDNVVVFSSDLSEKAVELTSENIAFLNLQEKVKAAQSDLFASYETTNFYDNVDVIVCNPPYISTAKVSKMDREISENEPVLAFDGGMLGLKIIQKLLTESPNFLRKNGWLAFELGLGQGPFILNLIENNKAYDFAETFNDTSGNIRAIAARKA